MKLPLLFLAASGAARGDVPPHTGWENLGIILSKPDNVAIVMMIVLFAFYTGLALRQAFKHDRLIREGRKQDILKVMQD